MTPTISRLWTVVATVVAITIFWSSFPAIATITNSASLGAGETTADGKLTLVVEARSNGSSTISLRNNSSYPVVVDEYSLSPGDALRCRGRDLVIASHGTRALCVAMNLRGQPAQKASPTPQPYRPGEPSPTPVPYTPEPFFGHASLQLSLTWHQLRRASPTESPTPTPTPSPQSRST